MSVYIQKAKPVIGLYLLSSVGFFEGGVDDVVAGDDLPSREELGQLDQHVRDQRIRLHLISDLLQENQEEWSDYRYQ